MKFLALFALVFSIFSPGGVAAAANLSPCDVTGAIGPEARPHDGVPEFDVARNCAMAFISKEAKGECIARENLARAKIAINWLSLSDGVRRICVERIPRETARAYFALADCVLKEGRLDRFRSTDASR
ncbi:hypothetical protein [Methylocapsa acidiphila]|uniref:hypothetical protein n=1 Tax=Methylocapsa acidiphila TaxID=133552 RepID=UPI0004063D5C|nr:hypothetical protein [Methylocapsa acidiphila]